MPPYHCSSLPLKLHQPIPPSRKLSRVPTGSHPCFFSSHHSPPNTPPHTPFLRRNPPPFRIVVHLRTTFRCHQPRCLPTRCPTTAHNLQSGVSSAPVDCCFHPAQTSTLPPICFVTADLLYATSTSFSSSLPHPQCFISNCHLTKYPSSLPSRAFSSFLFLFQSPTT